MATATVRKKRPPWKTMGDLLHRLGNIPPERIWLDPPPGTAREKDVVAAWSGVDRRLCELVFGTLVQKTIGARESVVAAIIAFFIQSYLENNDLGLVLGADGMFRLKIGLVRIPDVAFVSWNRLPEGELPDEAIASRVPELAAEVLSPSNTTGEIALKIEDYFRAGVRLVWVIDPITQTADEYTSATKCKHIGKSQALLGRDVLQGFTLPLKELFGRTKRRGKTR